jgi:hypothetical protein
MITSFGWAFIYGESIDRLYLLVKTTPGVLVMLSLEFLYGKLIY